jgi:hypothetical protein
MGQVDERDAVRGADLVRNRDREAGFADATGPEQGQQAAIVLEQPGANPSDVGRAADQRCDGTR